LFNAKRSGENPPVRKTRSVADSRRLPRRGYDADWLVMPFGIQQIQ